MDTRPLERIGLTKSEISVYMALLQLGQVTTGPIVDESRVTRSKIYDILERLKNKGLVSYIVKNSTKYFSAADPHNIIGYLDEKEKEIRGEKKSIEEILPYLLSQQQSSREKKIAELFVGIKGMENAFNIMCAEFERGEPFYVLGASEGENIKKIQKFFSILHKKRLKRGVKSFILFNESSKGLFKSQEKSKFVEARYLHETTPAAINIYKNYTIIAILKNEPITFLIRNEEVSNSFREHFKIMWKLGKS